MSLSLFSFEMPLGDAALTALIGLLIVFAVLAVLVGILALFKFIFSIDFSKKGKSAPVAPVKEADADEEEVFAAITAALMCVQSEQTVKAPFVIKSVKRIK